MADKTIKHFIVTRFFPKQDINYLYNILHVGFLQKQVELAVNNQLKSLANQTNKNFELVFLMHPKFFTDERYKFIFTALTEAAPVPVHFTQGNEYRALAQDAYDKYDFVIQSRMDFDDFLHKDAVADTHNQVDDCKNILMYGYCKGYRYVSGYGEMYPNLELFNRIGHKSILQSFIWKSSFAKNLPFVAPYVNHIKVKTEMKNFLEKNGVEFSESMFKQNTDMNAYVYFVHEFAHYYVTHNMTNPMSRVPKNSKKLTTADITKKQLEEDFGFTYELKSIE